MKDQFSISNAVVIEVIETNLLRRGNGVDTPVRMITQYWSKDGELLAERDPSPDEDRMLAAMSRRIAELEKEGAAT